MERALQLFGIHRWALRILERFTFQLARVSTGWLYRNASHRLSQLPHSEEQGGIKARSSNFAPTQGISGAEIVPYSLNTKKYLESLTNKGINADILPKDLESLSLPRWVREIQPFLQNQLSEHTRRAYETDLRQFFRFLDGKIDPSQLTNLRAEHIIVFRKAMQEGRVTGHPMAQSTVNRKLAVVKSFMNWLRLNQVVKENPAQLVKGFPQSQESSLQGLSDEEVRDMLLLPNINTRAGALHSAILHVLLYLGVRKGELIQLSMGDIAKERGVDVVKVRGKGHKIRILPLTQKVKLALDHYFWVCRRDSSDTTAPLFIPTKNNRTGIFEKRLNPNSITYLVSRYAKKAGILKPISPHSCRATCISNALDRKATHRSVQHLAGWSTPLMIQRYDKRREDLKNSAAFLVDYAEEEAVKTG